MEKEKKTYIADHSEPVLRSHQWRTAANSAAYLLDSIKPDMRILDVGCGPGTISADLAALVPQGEVIGIDTGEEVIEKAKALASGRGLQNLSFEVGDANKLRFEDQSFDIVHSHQVLQHVPDPVHTLREWKRVTKAGGIVASRVADMSAVSYYPKMMQDYLDLYLKVSRKFGGNPDGGCRVISWAMQAGFDRSTITPSASSWCFSSPEERQWWSGMWADRITQASFATNAIDSGLATREELDRHVQACRKWGECDNGFFGLSHGEILCRNVMI